ncbi:MAG: amidohydrolase family protein [Epsilonproteobacteria bacterium]|nr:amidohydrolase family protein [Campylobacterota bacterium]
MKLIKNALIEVGGDYVKKDILFDDLHILDIQENISKKREYRVVDANKAYVLPGLIDLNVRLANNILSKKNLEKLVNSAKKGGVTSAIIMSDFIPRLESSTLLDFLKTSFDNLAINLKVNVPLANEENEKLNNIATLLNNGASAIFGNSNINLNLLKRGLQYANMKQKPFFCFCYEPNLDDQGLMNEGEISFKLGLSGISKSSESIEVAKIAELSLEYDANIIFQSISTKRSLEIINTAKTKKQNLFSEVSIHHLLKNDENCDGFNTYAKILPPLRDESERQALLIELKKGSIDLLTSAHSPKSVLYKDVAFWNAQFGIGGVEEFFKLAYTFLVKKEGLPLGQLMKMCSSNPAAVLDLKNKGKIEVGFDADMFIFDPTYKNTIKNKTSIYNNVELFGDIKQVFVANK